MRASTELGTARRCDRRLRARSDGGEAHIPGNSRSRRILCAAVRIGRPGIHGGFSGAARVAASWYPHWRRPRSRCRESAACSSSSAPPPCDEPRESAVNGRRWSRKTLAFRCSTSKEALAQIVDGRRRRIVRSATARARVRRFSRIRLRPPLRPRTRSLQRRRRCSRRLSALASIFRKSLTMPAPPMHVGAGYFRVFQVGILALRRQSAVARRHKCRPLPRGIIRRHYSRRVDAV
jgi:hypothetical protein